MVLIYSLRSASAVVIESCNTRPRASVSSGLSIIALSIFAIITTKTKNPALAYKANTGSRASLASYSVMVGSGRFELPNP